MTYLWVDKKSRENGRNSGCSRGSFGLLGRGTAQAAGPLRTRLLPNLNYYPA
ncbi:hypothetical protein KNP414_06356 [Paenibacillus mucilaginosus KNP414]|uniref:Uncharacterized protein n=1 Tax=Paenibacillus mucilaginosus (strain KNP414) TaxID=1036673 RepID=F8FLW1_PAEMK|nr:hypothetical protein KNP414_06356 [Paenibacillus mucilaginosus KNP414]